MHRHMHRMMILALMTAALPTFAVAQTAPTNQEPGARGNERGRMERLSPEARARLQDGRFAMIKETLKLNDAQLKLWAPVEAHMRAAATERQQARAERRQMREQAAARPALPDRLDRASQRMAKRAEQMKAFSEAFKPFYASLTDDQKSLAGVVLHQGHGRKGRG
jgi:hypothetical protein